ncbi:MFS transporter [Ensifer sesbaniae]|uniref:MFS transporter n=1 Tax=Ensifer sesbaniae TaxID=1214071 RepID=UPI0020018E8F|nr:MFS transporter [Ensifer sesbaniae]
MSALAVTLEEDPPPETADNAVKAIEAAPAAIAEPAPAASVALSWQQKAMLVVGLSGSFLVNVSGPLVAANIIDVQGGVGLTPDEGSWLVTSYLAASLMGVILSGPIVKAFGIRRAYVAAAAVFTLTAILCLRSTDLVWLTAWRGLQGFTAGFFGPMAFASTFIVMSKHRLPLGLTVLSFVLVLPPTLSPVLASYLQEAAGWGSLFVAQVASGAVMAVAGLFVLPRQPVSWPGLKADWVALLLLATALGATTIVLSQGTRQFWLESATIVLAFNCAVSAAAGFIFVTLFSPIGILVPALFLRRGFSIPILLNLAARAGLVVTGYLIPQFLATVQGYRPGEVATLLGSAVLFQLLSMPLAWHLHRFMRGRNIMTLGLLMCGLSAIAAARSTSLTSGPELQWVAICFVVGVALFLAADLRIGALPLKLPELPTASFAFNISTIGGTTLGTGFASNLATEAEKFHSNVLTEHLSLYSPWVSDQLTGLAMHLSSRVVDGDASLAGAASLVAAAARKQAWVLAFNDSFLVVGVILVIAALVAFAVPDNSAPQKIEG